MVWGPLAVGGLAVYVIGWRFDMSLLADEGSVTVVLTAWTGIVAAALATSGVAWLRICLVNRPTFVCGGCGYDLRGCGVPSAPCSECGSELRHTEVPAFRTSPWGLWILIPGVLLLIGAVPCGACFALLVPFWIAVRFYE